MNLYAIVILIVLVVDFLLGLVSDLLNLKSLRQPVPGDL
jgi:hypothetical protein